MTSRLAKNGIEKGQTGEFTIRHKYLCLTRQTEESIVGKVRLDLSQRIEGGD